MLFDERAREAVVAGRHRRVRREDDLRGDAPQRLATRRCLRSSMRWRTSSSGGERAVAFVQVSDAGRDAERRERAHAADAEQQLLADADALVAAVEPRGQLAIFGLVAFDVRVEQQQRVAADGELPDARERCVPVRVSIATVTGSPSLQRRPHRQRAVVDVDVVLVLPALAIEPLPEVALVVIEADADQRHAEVRRALDVVAGEDAEAARVDRQRLVEAELGGEVGDRPRPEHAGVARAPGVRRVAGTPAAGGRRS